jgi:4a-hydroxytetrahydrobiopterin dehydratase
VTGTDGDRRSDPRTALAAMQCRPGAPLLSADELRERLLALPGWAHSGARIEKTFRFADYERTIAFVNAVAALANRADHHPDLGVHYGRCVVAWSTHDTGGVTLNDCICAAKVDTLAG